MWPQSLKFLRQDGNGLSYPEGMPEYGLLFKLLLLDSLATATERLSVRESNDIVLAITARRDNF
jgi:hypothetical protein